MAKPVANFSFIASGLSVNFTDSSSDVPTQWNWDFGFQSGEPPEQKTSILRNPTIEFPNGGVFSVTLISQNSEGISDPYTFNILVKATPTLNLTIAEMVECNLPAGLAVDTKCFRNSIQTWQLFLQPYLDIPDADVFDESKWDPIANTLISKLIIYDIIRTASQSSMTSYYIAMKLLKANNTTTTTTVQVADYIYNSPFDIEVGETLRVDNLLINGAVHTQLIGDLTSWDDVADWLNTLDKGVFIWDYESNIIKSLGNTNFISTFNVTKNLVPTGTQASNGTFTVANVRVVPITSTIEVNGGIGGESAPGPIKYIEVGPSKTEWYDSSDFWSSMFSGKGGGGIFNTLTNDICMWAERLGLRLPMCPDKPSSIGIIPIVIPRDFSSKNCCSKYYWGIDKVVSKG